MALAQLREEFNRMSQLAGDQTMTLSRLLSEQNTMASSLSEVARDLSAAGVSTSLRQREMNDELGALVRRLDALAGTLTHIASGGDSAWLQGSGSSIGDEEVAPRPRKSVWPGGSR
jgi:ABC-type transporter Mla subunit MlaD